MQPKQIRNWHHFTFCPSLPALPFTTKDLDSVSTTSWFGAVFAVWYVFALNIPEPKMNGTVLNLIISSCSFIRCVR